MLNELTAAFAAFCAEPSELALSTFAEAAKPLIRTAPAPWRPVTAPGAFDTDFSEFRLVTNKMLRLEKLKVICEAVGYAFAETVVGEPLVLKGMKQKPEIVKGCLTGEGKNVLTFTFDSQTSRRSEPDFAEAFAVAKTRIFEGSPVRTTDRAGAGTRGTKLVQGIGADYCKVEFFVR